MKSSCQQEEEEEEEEEEAEEEEEEEEVSASVLRTCYRNYVATQVKNAILHLKKEKGEGKKRSSVVSSFIEQY